jgi:hypothetical protein
MSMTEPKDLMDVLTRLDEARQQPAVEKQRRYRRFSIRGDARIEPVHENALGETIPVLLRDISRGGIGFLVDRFIEPGSYWRLRFMSHNQIVASQPIAMRFCRLIEEHLYIAGGQFIVEPYIMAMLGVGEEQMQTDDLSRFSEHDVSEFIAPESLAG